MSKWFVYIVETKDNTLYCGISTDVDKRINAHNSGKGAKYTKPEYRRPVKLVYSAEFPDKSSAAKEEWRIKQLSRNDKLKLIEVYKIRKRVLTPLENNIFTDVFRKWYKQSFQSLKSIMRVSTIEKIIYKIKN